MINKLLGSISKLTESSVEVAPDICLLQFTVVNVCLVGSSDSWMLVDTALHHSADFIINTAAEYFGKDNPPQLILLTHGHFDHIGSVLDLAETWDVPVFAHEREIPYLTGKKDYPLPDPSADEGLIAKLSPSFPHRSINLDYRAVALPRDGRIPGFPEWRWIHTPGHTEGHVSFFRKKDKTLLVGDAFTTTKQESALSVLTQAEQVKGPPAYFTSDWETAEKSVAKLRALEPELAIPSHGLPLKGKELTAHLDRLVRHFKTIAVPDKEKDRQREE
ncbi:MBL fold metallo-hydrolase [Dehalobacter sp. DCM]|uniref:MBL fold metallo-hydrolase n=1 Tax=Dehalobacter sp. DCM TaxID=2907827 RepID=UPI003081D249|nr:MBL fold metallo-hydrolase [Dehalobacter sp. DCM]